MSAHVCPRLVGFIKFRLMLLTDLSVMKISLASVLDRSRPLPPSEPNTPSSGVTRTALLPHPSVLYHFI